MWTPRLGRPPEGQQEISEAIEWWTKEGRFLQPTLEAATKLMNAQKRYANQRVFFGWLIFWLVFGSVGVFILYIFVALSYMH